MLDASDAYGIKSEFPSPGFDLLDEFIPISRGVTLVHPAHDSLALALDLPNETATQALGQALSAVLPQRLVVFLEGDLGAGKTSLVRSVLRGLGYEGKVKSPTYTLVEVYAISRLNFHHFDFYRFNEPEEYLDAGLDESFLGDGLRFVEWPDKAGMYLPQADLHISLAVIGDGRCARIAAATPEGQACMNALRGRLNKSS
jgi:tRNA threonylcarbamoyladenosine biosynthesis protein TsaE